MFVIEPHKGKAARPGDRIVILGFLAIIGFYVFFFEILAKTCQCPFQWAGKCRQHRQISQKEAPSPE